MTQENAETAAAGASGLLRIERVDRVAAPGRKSRRPAGRSRPTRRPAAEEVGSNARQLRVGATGYVWRDKRWAE